MLIWRCHGLLAFCIIASIAFSREECTWDEKSECSSCKLVVAPSTIPGAGLGIFTLVELQPNELVGYGDLVIPIPPLPLTENNAWEDYSWNGRIYFGELNAFTPGLQSLTNSHMGLVNIHQVRPATKVFENTVDSTPYHDLQTIVDSDVQSIPAGGELFTVYGDHWFEGRERFTGLATSEDYLQAEQLTKDFDKLAKKRYEEHPWQFELWEMVGDVVALWKKRSGLLSVLPQYFDVQQVLQLGIRSLYEYQGTRDLGELMGNSARCVDGIRPGSSEIHHLGAFATRSFSKGAIVIGSPMLHSIKHHWNARAQVYDSFTKSYKAVNSTGDDDYALLVNYCWSHEESSILLCPYGIGVSYINHSDEPNMKIQWAPDGQLSQSNEWFKKTPAELSKTKKAGLSFDYVALREIQEGEELTLDYGKAWKAALREYQQRLETTAAVDSYNDENLLKTEAEQVASPYPSDIELKCHPNVMNNELPMDLMEDIWMQVNQSDLLECHIMERQFAQISDGSTHLLYAVRVWYQGTWRGRAGIARAYLKWFVKEQRSSFRFPMQIPNDMVPRAWKDA